MRRRHELLVSTLGTDNWHLPNAASTCMLTVWVDEHEGAHRTTQPIPAGRRAAQPGLTGSTTRSAQPRGAEVVDRHPTLARKAALGPPPHSDVWFREPTT